MATPHSATLLSVIMLPPDQSSGPPSWMPPPIPIRPEIRRCNHILHLLLTLITFGVWAIVWILVAINRHVENRGVMDKYRRQVARYQAWALLQHRNGPGQLPPQPPEW